MHVKPDSSFLNIGIGGKITPGEVYAPLRRGTDSVYVNDSAYNAYTINIEEG